MATDFVAGLFGGFAGVLTGHPFDTVKLFGLFKGMASPMVSLCFINAMVFGVQANVMRLFDTPTLFSHWVSGAAAGALQSFVAGPMELAKIRMQMEGIGEMNRNKYKNYHGSMNALGKIYEAEGFRGLSRGLSLTLLRDSPAFGIYFATFEAFCRGFAKSDEHGYVGIGQLLLAGGLGGTASWISTYAFDVVKTRIQADGVGGVNRYSGIADVIVKSYREGGVRVFHKGLGITLLRAFPVNATTFTVVALSLRLLNSADGTAGHGSVAAVSREHAAEMAHAAEIAAHEKH